jgi:hypothetical protein
MIVDVGDLVRVRGKDWLGKPLGIVIEVRQLVHAESGDGYTAVTALVGGSPVTFSERDFEVIKKVEKNE